MKLSSRIAGGLVVVCALTAALAGCSGGGRTSTTSTTDEANAAGYTLVEDGKLVVASDLANPPFDFVNESTAEAQGFEVDLMDALAERLGLTCEYLPAMKFDSIIPLIKQGGKADVGVSNFTITDNRKQEIDFTDPYIDSNQGLVTRVGSDKTDEDALNDASVTIAVQSGTTGASWVEENLPQAQIVSLDDPVAAVTGVSTGRYDAAVADLPVMQYLCTNSFTDCQVSLEIPTGEQYGIVVSKDNPGLTAALNDALTDLEADGTISTLEVKWFGAEL
ncbi:ABC transporter substrate-binding protein [Thermophilibacter immobilis]|uniref:Amino acid ABC transporter substrate-binding protein n=1 Tax=Thermophilibacter immobilis TaxID=2779519 RepID=A0A7S7RV26_9ACTN|nr:ABC transporter substrate-binding protein [Thermophilibacter immobilis]QOY61203.1 amino acid ABC transporter substrate-binding protein [Thermophilibacter immobilis]